jgi:hypothetical protein
MGSYGDFAATIRRLEQSEEAVIQQDENSEG